ncbi:HD domain-containing phosphohydrolase [Vibrio rotiferianus]|uniref:HD domain-containing phosphohydrolase n=1 Tax=Vibrio rotiferianus TaxID=190895 RepID=UPI002893AFDD|nr:Phosphohydrolase [Vibrio rotiferianus]CAH1593639.1 Phosphohydrolase [Vibrio rotiferianus]
MKNEADTPRKFSIKFTVGSLFIFATAVTALLGIGMQYYFGKQMSEEHILTRLTMTAKDVSSHIHQIDASATSSAGILRSVADYSDTQFSEDEIQHVFTQTLIDNPVFYSIYFANQEEFFFQVVNLESSSIVRGKIGAAPDERWAVIKIVGEGEERTRYSLFYSESLELIRTTKQSSNFYPSRRPWFDNASKNSVYKTEPYLFQHLKITGQSYSVRSNKGAVIGVDTVLSSLSEKITATELGMKKDDGVESFIFNNRGEVIASSINVFNEVDIPDSSLLVLSERQKALLDEREFVVSNQNDWGPYDYTQSGKPSGYAVDVLNLISQKTGMRLEFVNGFSSRELEQKYRKGEVDILQPVLGTPPELGIKSDTLFIGQLAIATKTTNPMPTSLRDLGDESVGVVAGFGMKEWLLKRYPSLNIVEQPNLDLAKRALHMADIQYLVDSYLTMVEMKRLVKLTNVHVGLLNAPPLEFSLFMKEKDKDVVELINQAITAISPEQKVALQEKWLKPHQWRGSFVPYPEVYEAVIQKDKHDTMNKVTIEGEHRFLYITKLQSTRGTSDYFAVLVSEQVVTDAVTSRLSKAIAFTSIVMVILFPLAWKVGSPIVHPILALRKETIKIKNREFDQLAPVETRIKEVSDLSNSVTEMTQEIQHHEQQQEEFVEAFIRLIAQAIDDKSPYTAGHCNRVPEIGLMLAEAVEKCDTGKFKDFKFNNDDERREFRIAAWLHDCGKITTPEHIVDKGTKLEANYNRINEIRTRFEVLRRDAEVEMWKSISTGELSKEEAQAKFDQRVVQLDEDFRFVANANVGGEFMSDDKIERIKQIAQQTWLRHYDDHLGLSPFEEMIKPKSDVTLPVVENLLADKPDHIIERVRPMECAPEHGIKVQVPEHQYNLGEVYNLTISRGTLTPEDRFKINEHMISGIKMLGALPFPPELSNVPRYASTHHETLKGTGYPRRLSAEDLSTPERILVIADIFEALTAGDRPYKKAKPVSVAVDIMYKMALDEHLDMDLFLLFLESGVYRDYANKSMPAEQVDEVDIEKYLKSKSSDA